MLSLVSSSSKSTRAIMLDFGRISGALRSPSKAYSLLVLA